MGGVTISRNLSSGRPGSARPAGLESMRDMLRGGSLARSLASVSAVDRLSAAWTVVCGRALSERSTVVEYRDGNACIEIVDATWLSQLVPLRAALVPQLADASRLPVRDVEFLVRRTQRV